MLKYIIYYVLTTTVNIPCPYTGNPDIKCSVKQHTETKKETRITKPITMDSALSFIKKNPKLQILSIMPEEK